MKKKLAIWLHGGIGTGHFSQGYSSLEMLLLALTDEFEMVIFSQTHTNLDFKNPGFQIRSAPHSIKRGWLRWLWLINAFRKEIVVNKVDVIFAFWGYPSGFIATCLSKITGIPVAVYLLGSDAAGVPSIDFGILHNPWLRKIARWTYRNATLVFGISNYQKQQLVHYGINIPIVVIPWGADQSLFHFHRKAKNKETRFLHVGHLNPVKDQTMLLKAFALILRTQPAVLHLFGVDTMNGKMQRLSAELNLGTHVRFLDIVPYVNMPEQYNWADVMLHTSLSEGQSMALTEAAATGVLLAGTPVGLLHDLGDEYGVIATAGAHEELAEKVLRIIREPEEWNNKIDKARQWSEAHDSRWTAKEIKKHLNILLSGKSGKTFDRAATK